MSPNAVKELSKKQKKTNGSCIFIGSLKRKLQTRIRVHTSEGDKPA